MPELNGENNLDDLLNSMEDQANDELSEAEDFIDPAEAMKLANETVQMLQQQEEPEFVEQGETAVKEEEAVKNIIESESVQIEENEPQSIQAEVTEPASVQEEITEQVSMQTETINQEVVQEVGHEKQAEPEAVQAKMTAQEAVQAEVMGDEAPILSESDMERLSGMDLDNLIEDVTSETVSAEQLFGSASEEMKETVSEDKASEEMEQEKALESAQAVNALLGEGDASSHSQDDGKKKKKRKKGNKKGIFSVIKNVFFESLDDETPPEGAMAAGAAQTAKAKNKKKSKKADQAEILAKTARNNEGGDTKEETMDNADKLDENEQLLQEMYGNLGEDEHLDENAAPQKGFFAKLQYRFAQMKKKNEEEDRAEQEAEELELEEKRKKKEEKKEAAKEKKEAAKKEKENKPKKEKKPKAEKPKKEKKPKPEPKPGDILKIKPKSIILFVLFIVGVIVLIVVLNTSVYYNRSVGNAKAYMENNDFAKAYDALSGVKRSKNDETMYQQASVITYVGRQYESYQNFMKLGMNTEAINALIKGLDRYDTYYGRASELGVEQHIDQIKAEILKALQDDFKISETEAASLLQLSKNNFTQYYYKIEAYGKAKQ